MTENRAGKFTRADYQVPEQFPQVYREDGPSFVEFTKSFYSWLDEEGPGYKARRLLEYGDVDDTLDELLPHFAAKYLYGFPSQGLADKRFLVKHVLDVYRSKGSLEGIRVLFRLLYDEEVDVYVPSKDVIRASDGRWFVPRYFEVSASPSLSLYAQQPVTGASSGATAIVEDVVTYRVRGREVRVMYVSNIDGDFEVLERVLCDAVDQDDSPYIIGSLVSGAVVSGVANSNVGDLYAVEDDSGSGLGGRMRVNEVRDSTEGTLSFTLTNGGFGYTLQTPILIGGEFLIDETDELPLASEEKEILDWGAGSGAALAISSLSGNTTIDVSYTIIAPYEDDTFLSLSFLYQLPITTEDGFTIQTELGTLEVLVTEPLSGATINDDVIIADWETVVGISVGTIASISVSSLGSGYLNNPSIYVVNEFVESLGISDGSGGLWGADAVIDVTLVQGLDFSTGIKITDSGFGYAEAELLEATMGASTISIRAVLGAVGYSAGSWLDTDGMLNADKYVHDSYYYQEYSYDVLSSMSLDRYERVLRQAYHPVGSELFGTAVTGGVVTDPVEVDVDVEQT